VNRIVPLMVTLLSCSAIAQAEIPLRLNHGSSPPVAVGGSPRAMWSEPPDLNGLIGSSEVIMQYTLETELANDFVSSEPTITHVTWWGGYFNNVQPCDSGIGTPGFNLRFYADAECLPGDLVSELNVLNFTEEAVWCQGGFYPLFKYGADVLISVIPGNRYWFSPQLQDHPFPPQWGRLETPHITDCVSQFRSAYFGYPDWTGACSDVFETCDFSQEFDGDHTEACCFPDNRCMYLLTSVCTSQGGTPQGSDTQCDPNPCGATPVARSTWGSVRALYR
jgi:hypothetical protein